MKKITFMSEGKILTIEDIVVGGKYSDDVQVSDFVVLDGEDVVIDDKVLDKAQDVLMERHYDFLEEMWYDRQIQFCDFGGPYDD